MKKAALSISMVIVLSVGLIVPGITVNAKFYGDFIYTVGEEGVTITECNPYADGELTIPSSINGVAVTAIGDYAFGYCTQLTGITIPYGIIKIEKGTFYECEELINVSLPDSITSIGNSAFSGCSSLESITIPDSIMSIGREAFYNTSFYYDSSNWENSVLYLDNYLLEAKTSISGKYSIKPNTVCIADSAFDNCRKLSDIIIPDSVKSIGDYAFRYCIGLTNINIPDSVTSIGYFAFNCCTELTEITVETDNPIYCSTGNCLIKTAEKELVLGCDTSLIPSDGSVTLIGDGAFCNYNGFTGISIPYGVTSIGFEAFNGCTELTSINLPDSLKSIGMWAFCGCVKLKSIELPDGLVSIDERAFEGCPGLKSIKLPDSVTSIGSYAFYGCTGLTKMTIPDNVTSIEQGLFLDCTSLSEISIPDSITSMGGGVVSNTAFYNNRNNWEDNVLYSGKFLIQAKDLFSSEYAIKPDTVCIAASAFSYNTWLESITIPESVKFICEGAFSGCTGLTELNLPDGIVSIERSAFSGCTGLMDLNIPERVTSIGYNAFFWCTGIKSITVKAGNPVYHSSGNCLIETAEKKLILGCDTSLIPSDGSVTSIVNDAFYLRNGLKQIKIPDGVISIGSSAFSGCTGLTSVIIPDSVASISGSAFYNCAGLTSITIPESVTDIGFGVFGGCDNLTIYCTTDSYAESYSLYYKIPFKAIRTNSGDINGDCKVDIQDLIRLKKYFAGEIGGTLKSSADFDGKNSVDAADMVLLKQFILGMVAELTAHGDEVFDMNGDGVSDIRDLVRLKKNLSDPALNPLSVSGDLNGEGKVNAADLIVLKKVLINLFTAVSC